LANLNSPLCKWIVAVVRIEDVSTELVDFEEFYDGSRSRCLRAVMACVGDPVLAEDLVAEAFTRAWMSWPKVSRHPAPEAWVVRTALNTSVSWWRRSRREIPLADHDVATSVQASNQLDEAVRVALLRLPGRQREVIALRVFLDLDTDATARALGIAPGTVTAHLSRAISAMRASLDPTISDDCHGRTLIHSKEQQ
jgi:RNA polymerase sigma factor (sigma-70 family)